MRKFGDQRSSNTTSYNEYGSRNSGHNRPRPERKDGWHESRGGQRGERKDRDDYPRKSYNQHGHDRRPYDREKENGHGQRGGGRYEKESFRRDEGSRFGGGGGGKGYGSSRPQTG